MTFSTRKEKGHIELANKILNWNGRQMSGDLSEAHTWTDEELRDKAEFSNEEIMKFRKNLEVCGLNSKERCFDEQLEKKILASSRVVVRDEVRFIYNSMSRIYECGIKAQQRLMYDAMGSSKSDCWDFIEYDGRSLKTEVMTLKTMFIKVGKRFFDVVNGKMVDNAPDEFRTFGIIQDVDYKPVKFDECNSKLISELKRYFGAENLKYVLLNVAYNLTNIRVNKLCLIIVGDSRSGKGTLCKALINIGLAPKQDLSGDFSAESRFCDILGSVVAIFPIVVADECESINWNRVKKLLSDEYMSVEAKGDKKYTTLCRAMPILTTNTTPVCAIDGISNKVVIIHTVESFQGEIDPEYFEKIEAENGYEELINLILTMTHKMTLHDWNPLVMPDSVKEQSDDSLRDNLYHDMFFREWDKDVDAWVPTMDAYISYLMYANLGTSYNEIKMMVDTLKPNDKPSGYAGKSRRNFISAMKNRGIKSKLVHGYYEFKGRAPVRGIDTDVDMSAFQ